MNDHQRLSHDYIELKQGVLKSHINKRPNFDNLIKDVKTFKKYTENLVKDLEESLSQAIWYENFLQALTLETCMTYNELRERWLFSDAIQYYDLSPKESAKKFYENFCFLLNN